MPRVTVNRDTSAVTPLPTPESEQPVPQPDIPLTAPQADLPTPVEPVQPAPPVQQIVREIKTVLIEVPLCDKPPGLDGTPSFCKSHVNLQLIRSRSPTGRHLLHRLWCGNGIGFDATARTPPGCPRPRPVRSPNVSAAGLSRKAEAGRSCRNQD